MSSYAFKKEVFKMLLIKIVENEKLSKHGEPRFIIINNNTGEIIDDAQGYGYKSVKKALNSFVYCNGNLQDYNFILDKEQICDIMGLYLL